MQLLKKVAKEGIKAFLRQIYSMHYESVTPKKMLSSVRKAPNLPLIKEALALVRQKLNGKQFSYAVDTAYTVAPLVTRGNMISATLLYETKLSGENIEKEFNEDTRKLVESMRKIKKIESQHKNFSTKILSKIILATTKDIRTIIIALASKVTELKSAKKEDKQTAKIVKEVYLPISQKLGLDEIRWELEDLSFKILQRGEYQKIKNLLKRKKNERESDLRKIMKEVKKALKKEKINAKVIGRTKNFYAIYNKIQKKNLKITDLHDLIAIRVICNTIKECYIILGIIHSMYEPLLNCFDDYIANPKENNYRSIHTDVKTKEGKVFEAQVRTWEMNAEAEEGLPAHWTYKEIGKDKEFDGKLTWAKQLIEWNKKHKPKDVLGAIQVGFEEKKIFTLTPKADIIGLPLKSTPIDFAYAIHSAVGNRCEKVKVNDKIVPLDYELENGDIIEIITSKKQVPKRHWINIARTAKAKSRIKQALEIVDSGRERKTKIGKKMPRKLVHLIRISKCCNPLPGDKITAIKTTKRKITVHKDNCRNVLRENPKKLIPINWEMIGKKELAAEIRIESTEKVNLLKEILDSIVSLKGKVISTQAKMENTRVSSKFVIKTKNPQTIGKIIEKIRKIEGVRHVSRA